MVPMPRLACPRCGTHVTVQPGQTPACPACGHGAPAPPQTAPAQPQGTWHGPQAPPPPAWQPPGPPQAPPQPWGAPPPPQRAPPSQGIAIAALILNLLVLAGLGTLIGGRIGEGVTQLVLALVAVFLIFTIILFFIGAPLLFGVWIWGIVSGVRLLQESNQAPAAGYAGGVPPPY